MSDAELAGILLRLFSAVVWIILCLCAWIAIAGDPLPPYGFDAIDW